MDEELKSKEEVKKPRKKSAIADEKKVTTKKSSTRAKKTQSEPKPKTVAKTKKSDEEEKAKTAKNTKRKTTAKKEATSDEKVVAQRKSTQKTTTKATSAVATKSKVAKSTKTAKKEKEEKQKEELESKKILEKRQQEKKNLPEEIQLQANKKIFTNLIYAIAIMVFLILINLGFSNITKEYFLRDINVFTLCLLILTILVFEQAYKKDSGSITINGIELLTLSLFVLSLPIILAKYGTKFMFIVATVSLVYGIYYTTKSTLVYLKMRKDYITSLSDIQEIIKKEPKKKETK